MMKMIVDKQYDKKKKKKKMIELKFGNGLDGALLMLY